MKPALWQNLLQTARAMGVTWRRGWGAPAANRQAAPFRGHPALRLDDQGGDLCTACGACVDACPTECIEVQKREHATQFALNWQRCMCCGLCASICPVQAIEVRPEVRVQDNVGADREERGP